MVACGVKPFRFLCTSSPEVKASRTLSVVATTKASGLAAATRPLEEAMLRRFDVGGGSAFAGQGCGRNLSFASPLIARKPSASVWISSRSGPAWACALPLLAKLEPNPELPRLKAILDLFQCSLEASVFVLASVGARSGERACSSCS